jgi:hypothetical protein
MLRWRVRTSGAFVAAAFIPSETNAAVDVNPNPSAAASQDIALYRRFEEM